MAGGANRAWTDESTLTDPRYDGDLRVQLLRNPCPRCHAPRGQYCRTEGNGVTTLHKARHAAVDDDLAVTLAPLMRSEHMFDLRNDAETVVAEVLRVVER